MVSLLSSIHRRALGFGLGLGVVYQTVLIPAQPHLEPRFVWVEVVAGVGLAFAVAEIAVRQRADRTPLRWQDYRLALLLAFVGLGAVTVPYERINHLLLGRPV